MPCTYMLMQTLMCLQVKYDHCAFTCIRAKLLQSCQTLCPYGPQPTSFLCPWVSPGENTGAGCHALLRGSCQPRDQTRVSYLSCTERWVFFFTTSAAWEAPVSFSYLINYAVTDWVNSGSKDRFRVSACF